MGYNRITDKDEGFIVETVREAFPNPKIKRKKSDSEALEFEIRDPEKAQTSRYAGKAKSTRARIL